MAGPRDLLEQARHEEFRDGRGRRLKFELRPGLSAQQIADFEARLPGPIPPDVRDLLSFSSGFVIGIGDDWPRGIDEFLVDFTGSDESVHGQDSQGAIPHPIYVAADDAGNAWVVDVNAETGAWGVVMYVCHDPPVTLIQSKDLATFISDALDLGRPDRKSNIARVHQGDFDPNPDEPDFEFSAPQARSSSDPTLAKFAAALADNVLICDLRALGVGTGFDWTFMVPDSRVVRDGTNLIFAIEQKPQKPKKPGFFSRLFGRSGKSNA
jgi:cell wall assembly regulator SMI1